MWKGNYQVANPYMNERNKMKAQNQIQAVTRNRPWSILNAIAASVGLAFNREVKRNKLPGNVKVTASPENDFVQIIPIGKAESRRATQSCAVIAKRMKGKALS